VSEVAVVLMHVVREAFLVVSQVQDKQTAKSFGDAASKTAKRKCVNSLSTRMQAHRNPCTAIIHVCNNKVLVE